MLFLFLSCADAPAPLDPDDALAWLGRAPGNTFVEITDIDVIDDTAWVCTGVQGLELYDLSDPTAPVALEEPSFPGESGLFPRCQSVALRADRALVAAHIDEIQEEPWVALLDRSGSGEPLVLDVLAPEANIEEVVWLGEDPLLAAHEDGLLRLSAAGDTLSTSALVDVGANISRLAVDGERVYAGSIEGRLLQLDEALALQAEVDLGAPIQAIEPLPDGRLAVALGSGGVALVSTDGGLSHTGTTLTRGTALRLSQLDDGHLVVANWEDVRIFDVRGDAPELVAVEDVFDAGPFPRTLAAAATGDVVLAGEWTGLHLYRWQPGQASPELTGPRVIRMPAGPDDARVVSELHNEGSLDLHLIEATPPPGWRVEALPTVIPPGESAWLDLTRLGGASEGDASLILLTDDVDESAAAISLRIGGSGATVGDDAPVFSVVGINTGAVHAVGPGQVTVLSYFATF